MLLCVTEQVLHGIELGRIARQPLEHDVPVEGFDVVAHQAAAVSWQPVPYHQQLAADGALEGFEKLHHLHPGNGAVEESEVKAPQSHPGHQRKLLPVEAVLQHWCLPSGRPGAHASGPLAQSRLVDEDDSSSLSSGVFFRADQRFCFHSRIASSSRCVARPTGRCGLKPSSRNRRQTCEMLKAWPKSRSINFATLARVHTSVGNPLVTAPCSNCLLSCARCFASSAPGRPKGLRRHACGSSSSMRAQLIAVCRLTPQLRATSACDTPRASMRIPRRRRLSSSLKSRLYRFVAMQALRVTAYSDNAHGTETVVSHLRETQ